MSSRVSRADVENFVALKSLAVVGVSRNPQKFGNLAFRELKARGYRVYAVNRFADQVEDAPCYPDLQHLPEGVEGVVIVVPPADTEQVIKDAEAAGIRKVWMQQGSESESSIQYCKEHGIAEVHGECILMFSNPVRSYHKFHRGLKSLFGQLPR